MNIISAKDRAYLKKSALQNSGLSCFVRICNTCVFIYLRNFTYSTDFFFLGMQNADPDGIPDVHTFDGDKTKCQFYIHL